MRQETVRGYTVYEDGRVLGKYKGTYRKIRLDKDGYPTVGLWENGKRYDYHLHRLLALCFIPNPDNLPCINHIDGDKSNYSLTNLEWCTYRHNAKHAMRTGLWKFKPRSVENAVRDSKGRFSCGT